MPAPKSLQEAVLSITSSEAQLNRFLGQIRFSFGCWSWLGSKTTYGYGRIYVVDKTVRVHRLSYEIFVGPIPEGLVIDHLCRNKLCVNPDHLEIVTDAENMRRQHPNNSTKQTCPRGHTYDYTYIDRNGNLTRDCKACRRNRTLAWKLNNPERLRQLKRNYYERSRGYDQ